MMSYRRALDKLLMSKLIILWGRLFVNVLAGFRGEGIPFTCKIQIF